MNESASEQLKNMKNTKEFDGCQRDQCSGMDTQVKPSTGTTGGYDIGTSTPTAGGNSPSSGTPSGGSDTKPTNAARSDSSNKPTNSNKKPTRIGGSVPTPK